MIITLIFIYFCLCVCNTFMVNPTAIADFHHMMDDDKVPDTTTPPSLELRPYQFRTTKQFWSICSLLTFQISITKTVSKTTFPITRKKEVMLAVVCSYSWNVWITLANVISNLWNPPAAFNRSGLLQRGREARNCSKVLNELDHPF